MCIHLVPIYVIIIGTFLFTSFLGEYKWVVSIIYTHTSLLKEYELLYMYLNLSNKVPIPNTCL